MLAQRRRRSRVEAKGSREQGCVSSISLLPLKLENRFLQPLSKLLHIILLRPTIIDAARREVLGPGAEGATELCLWVHWHVTSRLPPTALPPTSLSLSLSLSLSPSLYLYAPRPTPPNCGLWAIPLQFEFFPLRARTAISLLFRELYICSQEKNDVKLEKVLKEAAMENKTVILTTLNAAWASPGSIIDLFFQSFRIGDGTRRLLDHLFTNLKYSRVEIDEVWFEWAECMLDYI
ncbi:hypothetical protein ZIOFF_055481 [Zingiber officinale]|uniref:Uncharacterized protein n=1 Tax=Zingiber officinale TaxID=94328 RepID=A0A8J5FGI4_ZINOF|nr:hypothetical protein ZIOFF_055481 [Zingiber officinale]